MNVIHRARRAFTARIERLNVEYCNPALNGATIRSHLRAWPLNGLVHLAVFVAKELAHWPKRPRPTRVLACVGSYNNFRSADAAFGDRADTTLATFHNFRCKDAPHVGLLFCYMTGAAFLPLLPLLLLLIDRPVVRKFAVIRLDQFVLSLGSRLFIRQFLRRSEAESLLIFSNLTVYHNLLIEEARRLGIVTVFATHAPVGRGQVALRTDYALLDGERQTQLYPRSGTTMIVTGSVRGALLVARKEDRSQANGIVIATNSLIRDMTTIEAFITRLRSRYPDRPITIRPHPSDRARRKEHFAIAERMGIGFSSPEEPLATTGDGRKYLVTALSGALVDATLIGLYPLILRSPELDEVIAKLPADYYGLIELGLARYMDMADPRLPEGWSIGPELELLDLSARKGWDARKAMNDALNAILDCSDKSII